MYLFIGVIVFLVVGSVWLSRFSPDLPTNKIASITVEKQVLGVSRINFAEVSNATALSTMLSRGNLTKEKQIQEFSTESQAIFVTYEKIRLPTQFVPLGFTTLYRIRGITNASGDKSYNLEKDTIDQIFAKFGMTERETVTVLARDRTTSYTVLVSVDGIITNEN